jgi:hypothetical protein
MDFAYIVPILALVTLLAVIVFAMMSKKRTEERLHDSNAPKSTLAPDASSHREDPPDT